MMFIVSTTLTPLESFALSQVNVIPVIAKADTISRSELSQFKARVSNAGSFIV